MRLGISSYSFPWAAGVNGHPKPDVLMDPLRLAALAKEMEVSAIQIADNLPLHIYDTDILERLREYCEANGIIIEVGTRGIGVGHISAYTDIAVQLGAKLIRTLLPREPKDQNIEEVIASLLELTPLLEYNGVMLAIENYELYSCSEYARIFEELPKHCFGLCLDTANNLGIGETVEMFMDALGDRIINLHVKDIKARRCATSMGFVIEGTPAGTGIINLPQVLKRVNSIDSEISVILEQWPPFAASVEETVLQEQRWAALGVSYLAEQLALI